MTRCLILRLLPLILFMFSCSEEKQGKPVFDVLPSSRTGIGFNNKLTPTADLNMLKYMYFYNGAGVGAGDLNNDGLIDLFFAGNQVKDRLYLNEGDLRFRDATVQAGITDDKGWSTGVSIVDINNDGMLDIHVCRVGNYGPLQTGNRLLVCTGIGKDGTPHYEERSREYGLDFSGFSTQAAFFDQDLDGDLDMYLLNHSLRYNSTFNERPYYRDNYDSLSGDRMFRNDGGRFTDITRSSGINSSVIGYGLGICVSDVDLDGYPDLYVANDFHENDYLYINQRDGTFRETGVESLMHTSQFSMGVDIADINGDAYPEIITLDMLPEDPYILRRSLGEDEYNLYRMKLQYGYHYQYTRNNLQLNRGNGMFSEVGLYAGIAATDWSWSPLWMDFDNDGKKDLFISNGIPKRLNDIDYVNYISGEAIQSRIRSTGMDSSDLAFIEKFPQIKLHNKLFRNRGEVRFGDMGYAISNDRPTYSNGAVYADLDNDGDLDIAVNNIDDEAMIYRNNTDDGRHLRLILKGPEKNPNAIGARVLVHSGGQMQTQEKFPVHGFQSSMEIPLHVGTDTLKVDSIIIIWPDRTHEKIVPAAGQKEFVMNYRKGLPAFDYARLKAASPAIYFEDITSVTGLDHTHRENEFVEFNREPLIPFMVSTEGPAVAVGDMNSDGKDDLFIGSARGYRSGIYLQTSDGRLLPSGQPALDADSSFEDTDAIWTDVNHDGYPDLVVASGGNEFYGNDEHLLPRLYLNEGGVRLVKKPDAFRDMNMTLSTVVAGDFDKDGHVDLFFGGRAVPFAYGAIPRSYLLLNDGKGMFRNAEPGLAPGLSQIGMVKDAEMADMDGDRDDDLVLALEWGGIVVFNNEAKGFVRRSVTQARGWWNFIKSADIDNDGDLDLIAGNLGLNSRLKASREEPVRMYVNDFDDNGTREQVLTYHLGGKEIPFANKAELEKQMPVLKKKFLYAEDFAKATISDIFGKDKLNAAQVLSADDFSNSVFINEGKGRFTMKPLPYNAQFSPYRDAAMAGIGPGGFPDILMVGNFFGNNVQLGRHDADFGTLLRNRGGGEMVAGLIPGLTVKGEVRAIRQLKRGDGVVWVLVRNNATAMVISKRDSIPAVSQSVNR